MSSKKALLANLIKIAKADGEINKHEIMLIYGLAHKNGISKMDMEQIVANVDSYSTFYPNSREEKIKFFYLLLTITVIDLDVNESELELLSLVGGQLGLDKNKVSKAIAYVKENLETDLTEDQVDELLS